MSFEWAQTPRPSARRSPRSGQSESAGRIGPRPHRSHPVGADPQQATGATNPVTETARRGKQQGTSWPATVWPPKSAGGKQAEQGSGQVWRAWTGVTSVGSFRLPHELLVELDDTARELQLPIGMIVTAAITQLLDQPPQTIVALVDKADDARIHGRSERAAAPDRPGEV